MTIIYKAFDNVMFTTKEACECYEESLHKNLENIGLMFYDCEGRLMPTTPDGLSICSFVYIKNLEALNWLIKFGDSIDTIVPKDQGLWYWNGIDWVSLKEQMKPWKAIWNIVCKDYLRELFVN